MRISAAVVVILAAGCGGGAYDNVALADTPPDTSNAAPLSDALTRFSPWGGDAKTPPQDVRAKPFEIDTMHGDETHYNADRLPLTKAPVIDSEAVFDAVIACYPTRSRFGGLSVNLQGQASTAGQSNTAATTGADSYRLGQNYVGIVATMPLYSDSEIDRKTDREYRRRMDTAQTVARFTQQIAARNQQLRLLSMYRALEARAQKRVQMGIVGAAEQITYLEKVSAAHTALINAESGILEARLKLVGRCRDGAAQRLNEWLKGVAAPPDGE